MTSKWKLLAAAAACCLTLAACGGTEVATESTESESSETVEENQAMDDTMEMEDDEAMEGMSMGDADATPAEEVADADLTVSAFTLLDTSPEGFDALDGTAAIARYDGTTITIEFTGLAPSEDYVSHLHSGSCEEAGGPHFKFDPDGSDMPPNEIHLAFTSDADGNGFMTAENDMAATGDGQSVVVHRAGAGADKIACAQF